MTQKDLAGWIGRHIARKGYPMTKMSVADIMEELELKPETALGAASARITSDNISRIVRMARKAYAEY